jgi:hypothetical protein
MTFNYDNSYCYHIYWLRDNQKIEDVNIDIKTQIMNDECSESIMKIVVCHMFFCLY